MVQQLRVPAEAFPPGAYLREELEARGWTQEEFAEIIGRSVRLVNEIIMGKRGITPATAKELGAALGTSPQLWMSLDAAYHLHRAVDAPERINREARLREVYPVREMVRRGWIEPSENAEVLQTRVLQFFRTKTLDEKPHFRYAAHGSEQAAEPSRARDAWLFRVRQIAEAMPSVPYSEQRLRAALAELKALLADPEEIRHVPRILAECGVRFVVVEPLAGSKIDGACFWIGRKQNVPVIGMSLRYDRIDNFWFYLLHEIEHVLRGDGKDEAILDADIEASLKAPPETLPAEEQAANAAAAEFCVPQALVKDFIARVRPIFAEHRVVLFAESVQVHPGIVVGQLQRQLDRYDLLRKYLVKIREHLLPSAMTDGYGVTIPNLLAT